MQRNVRNTLWISTASVLLTMTVGLSGCSMFSPADVPIDCDVVKQQVAAGQTDDVIASHLNTTPDKVAACHGPETGGNKNTLIPEKGY